jgi:hypothetical protein
MLENRSSDFEWGRNLPQKKGNMNSKLIGQLLLQKHQQIEELFVEGRPLSMPPLRELDSKQQMQVEWVRVVSEQDYEREHAHNRACERMSALEHDRVQVQKRVQELGAMTQTIDETPEREPGQKPEQELVLDVEQKRAQALESEIRYEREQKLRSKVEMYLSVDEPLQEWERLCQLDQELISQRNTWWNLWNPRKVLELELVLRLELALLCVSRARRGEKDISFSVSLNDKYLSQQREEVPSSLSNPSSDLHKVTPGELVQCMTKVIENHARRISRWRLGRWQVESNILDGMMRVWAWHRDKYRQKSFT